MTLLNDMHTDWDVKDNDTRPAIITLKTSGRGYWSDVSKPVGVTALMLGYVNEDNSFGELRVHFNTDTWRPDRDGLIYTDEGFIAGLRTYLDSLGFPGKDIDYSEQGMQGDNYVSMDVGEEFIAAFFVKFPKQMD